MEITQRKTGKLIDALQKRELSALELLQAVNHCMEKAEPQIRAFISFNQEDIYAQAKAIDERRSRGEMLHPLAGIPVALKDNICTKEMRTTCGSTLLENYLSPYEATVVQKLKEAGLIILGKTNMDEFSMGLTTEDSAFFPTSNPFLTAHVPGGSSGGSAAAVAAGESVLALGSDSGGSIRQPAAYCGVVGLNPTYGLVSRHGLIAFISSTDQVGPLARDVEGCALLLDLIAGFDRKDPASVYVSNTRYSEGLSGSVAGLRVGLIAEHFNHSNLDPGVKNAVTAALSLLAKSDVIVEEISLPSLQYSLGAYYIIAGVETLLNLARFDGGQYGLRQGENHDGYLEMMAETRSLLGLEVKKRLSVGALALDTDSTPENCYQTACKVRALLKAEYERALQKYDLLVAPTTPTPAIPLGVKYSNSPVAYQSDYFTVPSNLAGLPAISLPCGQSDVNLPLGIEFVAAPFKERLLLRMAYHLEQKLQERLKERISFV